MGTKRWNLETESGGAGRYDDELLCANWNPVIDLVEWSCSKTLDDTSSDAGKDFGDTDIDALLNRIYRLGG